MPVRIKHYHTSDPEWRMIVKNYLRAGFGTEDIALKLRRRKVYPRELYQIRELVASLRREGVLASLYHGNRTQGKS